MVNGYSVGVETFYFIAIGTGLSFLSSKDSLLQTPLDKSPQPATDTDVRATEYQGMQRLRVKLARESVREGILYLFVCA
jgi:hypothetical protein